MQKVAARTDPGKKRQHNEDAMAAMPEQGIYVVADGVGGRAAGEVAAAICVDAFRAAAAGIAERVSTFNAQPTMETRNGVLLAMDETCQTASRRIYETAESEGKAGMTTTLVVAVFGSGMAFLCHVGDSRAYLVRNQRLHQLTEDHSMVNELVRSGKMTLAEARASRHRHVITRAVGLYPNVQPSLAAVDLVAGDRFVLCSDGLSDVVPEDVIALEGSAESLDAGAEALLRAALDNGGPDNITVILIDPSGAEPVDEAAARAKLLETLFLFKDMPYSQRLQVSRIMQEHHFAPGDDLFAAGSEDRRMYIMLEGEVRVERDNLELATLTAGEHFGELSLIDRDPRSATIRAATYGSAVSVGAEDLETFVKEEPALGAELLWKLLTVMGQRLRRTNERLAVVQGGPR
ncbi:MAG: cyclic nucleotide-binding domain-containing protein [Myxococcales bacterium]|nr:cyclic nucleotide-binding domain-containing protein [Myxococcales bacterium]